MQEGALLAWKSRTRTLLSLTKDAALVSKMQSVSDIDPTRGAVRTGTLKPSPLEQPSFCLGGARFSRLEQSTCRLHFFRFSSHITRRTTWKSYDVLCRVHGWSCFARSARSDPPCDRKAPVAPAPSKGCASLRGGEKEIQKRPGTQSREAC